jgi:hypothetical protein
MADEIETGNNRGASPSLDTAATGRGHAGDQHPDSERQPVEYCFPVQIEVIRAPAIDVNAIADLVLRRLTNQ